MFAPSAPTVFQNKDYVSCAADPRFPERAGNWYLCDKLPAAYPRFNPLVYSLDVLLPPVDLQQNKNWTPMTPSPNEPPWTQGIAALNLEQLVQRIIQRTVEYSARSVLWLEILFGWVSTLLLVAMVSGVMKRRED